MSPLTQTVRSIHMALSVVDTLLDNKKWSDIYVALDSGADVSRDARITTTLSIAICDAM